MMLLALNEIDICNFAVDATPYICDSNLRSVLEKLTQFWVSYLMSGNKNEYMWAKLDEDIAWERNDVELRYCL